MGLLCRYYRCDFKIPVWTEKARPLQGATSSGEMNQLIIDTYTKVNQSVCGEFSVPQIEYPLGGSTKKGSHVYFLLIVAMVLLL